MAPERVRNESEQPVNGIERILGMLLERTKNLQDDVSEMKGTVDSLKIKSSVHKGFLLGVSAVGGVAGGTLGSKILSAIAAALPK
jgi:hypothetical protein